MGSLQLEILYHHSVFCFPIELYSPVTFPITTLPAASRAHVIPKIKGTGCEALPRWMEGTQDVLRNAGVGRSR